MGDDSGKRGLFERLKRGRDDDEAKAPGASAEQSGTASSRQPDEAAIRAAAEREAMERLAEAERRAESEPRSEQAPAASSEGPPPAGATVTEAVPPEPAGAPGGAEEAEASTAEAPLTEASGVGTPAAVEPAADRGGSAEPPPRDEVSSGDVADAAQRPSGSAESASAGDADEGSARPDALAHATPTPPSGAETPSEPEISADADAHADADADGEPSWPPPESGAPSAAEPAATADVSEELKRAEELLAAREQRFESAIAEARRRLEEAEARAEEAEARAERARRLEAMRQREREHGEQLREIRGQIAAAERRAAEADGRVRELVEAAAAGPEPGELELSAVPDAEAGGDVVAESTPAGEPAPFPTSPAPALSLAPPIEEPQAADAAQPAEESQPPSQAVETGPADEQRIDINTATSQDLRGLGVGVIETGRILAERERSGGFGDLSALDAIRGLSPELRAKLKSSLRI